MIRALGILACVLGVASCDEPIDYRAEFADAAQARDMAEAENERLLDALELFTRNEGSCAMRNNGPRIFCWMKEGQVYRRELEPGEYVAVRGRGR